MSHAPVRRRSRRSNRRGAALVEAALVLPIMIMVVLGMFELGRAVMVTNSLTHAASIGARTGAITSGTTASVQATVNDRLDESGINRANCQVRILVNGVAGEIAAAQAGDEICVEISVPYADVTWVATPEYLAGKSLSGRCVMRRE
ncbi:MAG: TadE family protein [Planctomycetaceae bacterium]